MPLRPTLLATAALLLLGAGEPPASPSTHPSSTESRLSGAFGAYLAGHFAVQSRDLSIAADEFERALRDDPTLPELNNQAFLAALLAGQPQAARFAAALPNNPLAQLVLGDRAGKAGRWAAASVHYSTLPQEQGLMQVLRPLLLAWSEQGQGHVDAALSILTPLAESSRLRGVYALHTALIADLAGRTDIAARFYQVARADYGMTNLRLAIILASWDARHGRVAEAQRSIADLAAADGEFAMARQALEANVSRPAVANAADGLAEAYLALAATVRQQGADTAQALIRLALDLRPGLTAARLVLSDIEDSAKRPDVALAALADVPVTDPLAPLVELRRAALMDETGQSDRAIDLLERLAREHPDRPEPLAQIGDIDRRKNRFADAVKAYSAAIDRIGTPSRGNWPLFYARGIALERDGQWPKAEADLKYALELAPDQPSILNYLAYSWAERGEHLDLAKAMLERAIAARPNEGAFIDSLGWVLLRAGDDAGAIRQLERAVELEPEDPVINGHLGDALEKAGRLREAEFQWRRALNFRPDPDEAKRLEAKLAALPTPQPASATPGDTPPATVR